MISSVGERTRKGNHVPVRTAGNGPLRTGRSAVIRSSRWIYVGLGFVILMSASIAAGLLTRGHNWGDDFAAYILQAQSIVDGRITESIQRSTFTIEQSSYMFGPVTVPWGFPLMLAPVYAVFGIDILAFKMVLTLCYLAFLVAFYFLARTRLTDGESLLITAFMAFNLTLLRAQNEILSDLPFLMWSTVAIWLVERRSRPNSAEFAGLGQAVAMGLVICAAAVTRFNGLLLLIPLAVAQLAWFGARRRSGSRAGRVLTFAVPYAVFGLAYGMQALLLPSLGSTALLQNQIRQFSLRTILNNVWYYFLLPGDVLRISMPAGYLLYPAMLLFLVARLAQLRGRDMPMVAYGLATLGLYVSFPQAQGPRYIFPILPVFFLFVFVGMKDAAKAVGRRLQPFPVALVYAGWLGITIACLEVSLLAARNNVLAGREDASGPFSPAASSMFAFIRNATTSDSAIVFFKPRAMRLLTDRDSFLATNCEDLGRGDYAVIDEAEGSNNQLAIDGIQECRSAVALTNVYDDGEFVVYRVARGP